MSNVLKMLSRGGAAAAETDPNFNQTVLLLHGDGTNGAQNNTFLDSSTNNFTITRNGNTTQGTFSPFSVGAGEWSNYFDGSGDYLSVPDNNALDITTENLTVECWFYLTDTFIGGTSSGNEMMTLVDKGGISGLVNPNYSLTFVNSSGALKLRGGFFDGFTTRLSLTGSTTIQLNTWYHVALVRSNTTGYLFLNGVQEATGTLTGNMSANGNPLAIGYVVNAVSRFYFPGYISNTRIVKGTAVYTSNFTPSTSPLTAVANTSLLTCQSNRFVDNSTNAFAITRNGDVKVTPFSPFAPTAAYSAGTNGGSGYFDGTGDYLTAPGNAAYHFGSGDFTVEFWMNTSTTQIDAIVAYSIAGGASNTNWGFFTNGIANKVRFVASNGSTYFVSLDSSATVNDNAWHHVAAVRNGNTFELFVDGVSQATTTSSTAISSTSRTLYIGDNGQALGAALYTGYVSNLRVVKGTAVYTSNFTPSTTPLTAITNTSLLCNFTNAGIIDNTGKNNLETVGNAQIDTTTKKYGTGSMEFDGTGDYLQASANPLFNIGTGEFTIEGWIYLNNVSGVKVIAECFTASTGPGWTLYMNNATLTCYLGSGGTVEFGSSSSVSATTWTHFALVRSGSTITMYLNGTSVGSASNSSFANASAPLYVGGRNTSFPYNGFIDDLRITKGVARYTANFTAPTKEFPDL